MIFSNTKLVAKSKEMDFGTIHQIVLGENGRGRKEIRLACPEGTTLEIGCNFDFTIGETKSGRPRINKGKDNKSFFLLSTEGGYTRRGCGWVGSWKENEGRYKVLAHGNGADGLAGRIGYWDVVLLELVATQMPQNDWLRIRTSGGGYGTDPQWVSISTKGIFFFEETSDARDFADSVGFDFPSIDEYEDIHDIFNNILNNINY